MIEKDTLEFFLDKMKIDSTDSIIPGGRYHNRRDYMDFQVWKIRFVYAKNDPLPIPIEFGRKYITKISEKDYLLNAPYQSYSYLIKFL
jgi:polyphosphate kinase